MSQVNRGHLAGLELALEATCNHPVIADLIAQASAAPEQEPVAWMVGQTVWENRSAAVRYAADRMMLVRTLYAHADDGELERLRSELAKAQALLAKVINSGALSDDQHEELEADICAAVDVMATLKKQDFADHLEAEAEKAIAMPDYKRECVKSPALLSATAQPADGVKS